MVRPMVHSTKHIVQNPIETIGAGVVVNQFVAVAVAVGNKNLPYEVEEGSSIKACFLERWIRSNSATPSSGQWCLYKKTGDSTFPSAVDMAQLHDWDNKKNILAMGMGLYNDNDADAVAIVRNWYKIPKSKQRMGLGDVLAMSFYNVTVDSSLCGFSLYKEYT